MAHESTQEAPATASKVEKSAVQAGEVAPKDVVGNTDNADAIKEEFQSTSDASAARRDHVGV